jgi:hypothetical protein
MIEPLRLSLIVRCPAAHAFEVWTARASHWWPRSHTVTEERGLQIVFEPRPGGRIYERTVSGVEVDWGQITVWEPPRRLAYQWHTFVEERDGTTRVEIEHRGWERLGAGGPARRDANRSGWAAVLPPFATACGVV